MYRYDKNTGTVYATTGGYRAEGMPIRDTFVKIEQGITGVMYEPLMPCRRSQIAVIIQHPSDFTTHNMGGELAKRGYRTYCSSGCSQGETLDLTIQKLSKVVGFLREIPGITKVLVMGHSGGSGLMTAFQRAAENGQKSLKTDDMLYKSQIPDDVELNPADGIMLIDANYGCMGLLSTDPSVMEEGNGMKLNPEFDIYLEENGFDPEGHSSYAREFLDRYYAAQGRRNNEIVERALERLNKIEKGEGIYADDEPFVVTGINGLKWFNKLIQQDLSLLSHSRKPHDLVHADGSVTREIIRCLREPVTESILRSDRYAAAVVTSVRRFLNGSAVLTTPDYRVWEDNITGIRWDQTFNCPPANAAHIHAPMLALGMTGGYEYLAAEMIYDNCPSEDKKIAFIRGAAHEFFANSLTEQYPGEYGDTEKLTYDYMDQWMSRPGRFID